MRLGRGAVTTEHFSSGTPDAARSTSAASRGLLYFAWGCFRDFLSKPCRIPPKGRYAGSRIRDRQCVAVTGRIDPTPTHHALAAGDGEHGLLDLGDGKMPDLFEFDM